MRFILKYTVVIVFMLLPLSMVKAGSKLSAKAEISMLTCSPGGELYSLFGHSAIRVKDPLTQLDCVFNYGSFDFNTPNFYLKFARGNLPYLLSVSGFYQFKESYIYHKRSIYENVLMLDSVERQKLWDALVINLKPENRAYRYDFLFDNCATRVRDIIENNVEGDVSYAYTDQDKTFRDILDEYLGSAPWTNWGITTILGSPCDRKATVREYMFIPDYLMYVMESASKDGNNIMGNREVIYQAPQQEEQSCFFISPIFISSVVSFILIIFSLYCIKIKLINRWLDYILFGLSGIVGIVIFFLWFLSEHTTTVANYNILFFIPFHLIAIIFLRRKNGKIIRNYFGITAIIALSGLLFGYIIPIIPQALSLANIPVIILIAVRGFMIKYDK